ncbi:cobalt-precorrin-6A reductase [Pseudonocardia spinosispora]|uniref:cobalt-precorrin-6A reductase n=1 Tax=Pseudonocardia spinosispora TaxID=103441 RepID=UPI00055D74F3|nr:cobalt-precorrin-6A reductase [Pseudonocardia spinosispora]
MTRQVLILGGTGEARRLADALADRPEFEVVSSLAGRVRDPALPSGAVRVGGFGGSEGLAAYLLEHRVAAVVDATHPFAAVMTASAVTATGRLGVPLLVLRRPGWTPVDGDDWHWVPTLEDAARELSRFGERVFLTTGRTGLATFAGLDRHWFLLRSIDPPAPPVPRRMTVLLDRGPFTVRGERALLVEHRIDVLVTKDSGGEMTSAKLQAAREEGVPVLIQARPATPPVDTESTVAGALRWLSNLP